MRVLPRTEAHLDSNPPPPPAGQVYAIILLCEGDRRDTPRMWLRRTTIPLTHELFQTAPIASVSASIGFPIHMYRMYSQTASPENRPYLRNAVVSEIMTDRDSGSTPPEWEDYPGTCLAARMDGKSLDVRHLELLSEYCAAVQFITQVNNPARMKEIGWTSESHFQAWYSTQEARRVRAGFNEWKGLPHYA